MIKILRSKKIVNFDIESHNLILTKDEEKEIFDFGIREIDRRLAEGKTKGNLKMVFIRGKKVYDLFGDWIAEIRII
jgi:hypothetical protein